MDVWHLYHNGFAVETQNHFLIFDCYEEKPLGGTLADGVINPAEIAQKGKPVLVLASHRHFDHYTRKIFAWEKTIPQITYLLSDDIKSKEGHHIAPHETITLDDITIKTLGSTDAGVAFLVTVDGHTLYHAGDLNWWHWNGETLDYNQKMERDYKAQLEALHGRNIDLAFLPLDPRLEDAYTLGICYFLEEIEPALVLPMHFGDDFPVCRRFLADERSAPYREKILPIDHRGQQFTIR